jgi:hypothetical protein
MASISASSGGDDGDFVLRESVRLTGNLRTESEISDSRQRRAVADKVVAWRIVAEVH